MLGSCVLVLSDHAKLCVFYWVLMCLKFVIEDQVEDTKFAKEKHIFSTFLACTSIAARYLSIEAKNLLHPQHKLDLSRFCSWHKLDSSSIYWASRISKNQQREKAHNYSFETHNLFGEMGIFNYYWQSDNHWYKYINIHS